MNDSTEQGQRVLIVGQGYVGLPLAVRAVEAGFDVVGFDVDPRKVEQLQSGRSYIDDISDEDVARCRASGRFAATGDETGASGFDIAIITVPTPLLDGVPDLRYIRSAVDVIGPWVTPGCTVILESTTYPGTTEEIVAPRLEELSGQKAGVDFYVGFSPERIDPGNDVWDLRRTPKVVAGVNHDSLLAVQSFYDRIVDTTVPVSTTRAAELSKLLENTFRHVNIALVNEIAIHARAMGIDIWEVIEAASTKPFGYSAFWPGPGVGGHCLPIDPSYLSWKFEQQIGATSRFVEIANDVNNKMPAYVVSRVQMILNRQRKSVNGSRVLVVGLSYKKNSNDARETPSTTIISGLLELGAEVHVHDTWAAPHEIDVVAARVELTAAEVAESDVVVIVTDHDDIDYELIATHASQVFDTRNRMRGDNVETL
jgi:nucleotide sugar dehydrogenase